MDDDDADYMQGSDDEVCGPQRDPSGSGIFNNGARITDSTIRMRAMPRRRAARTSRTSTTPRNVSISGATVWAWLTVVTAKKEDNPEQALKEFRAIVDQEEEKGDWYAIRASIVHIE